MPVRAADVSGDAITVEGRTLKLSNTDKVLYPETGFTKGHVIAYYQAISEVLLPHLRDRALTMKRYPNGVDGEFFYQKDAPKHRPDWVRTVEVKNRGDGRAVNYTVVDDLPTLLWAANLADLELHTSLARARNVDVPTAMVFDLDPGPPATIAECCRIGIWLRDLLAGHGLDSYPKTSGSKGLQLYVPLNGRTGYDRTKEMARDAARLLEHEHEELVVSNMRKELRDGRVLIDWSQNDRRKTTISVYSLRARPEPTVSTPLRWDEVEECERAGDPGLLVFRWDAVLDRVEQHGDLFAPVLEQRQSLPRAGALDG
jgi:bifunctional non-homologous end joining protein LigD